MSLYLVTGGAGFIGSHLCDLLQLGHGVRVLDNLSTGSRDKLADVIADVDFVEGDLRNEGDCSRACREVDTVFHQAALPSVPRSIEDPGTYHENNVDGTFRLFQAARQAGCRRVIYAASSSAYGDQAGLPKHEDMLPAPLSPYALNKLMGEYYARVFYESYGLESLSLRYFNVFGPHQDPASQYAAAIPAFISALLGDRSPVVFGDGEQTRDFTPVENVVDANILAAGSPTASGQVLNVAGGARISLNQVIAALNGMLGKQIAPRYEPPRPGDIRHSQADITLAHRLIRFTPAVTFESGLASTLEWYKSRID